MKRYAITEGLGAARALRFAAWNLDQGVDMLQIREKQLPDAELAPLIESILRLPNPGGTRILVNGRADLARASGAHGVHFPGGLIPPDARPGIGFLIGVSCHTLAEVLRAATDGADFVVFGPVFATGNKQPQGLAPLRDVCTTASVPVYALGGIDSHNAAACLEAGAAGIAGITLFRPPE